MNPKQLLTDGAIAVPALSMPAWTQYLHLGVETYVFYVGALIVTLRAAMMAKEAYDKFVLKKGT